MLRVQMVHLASPFNCSIVRLFKCSILRVQCLKMVQSSRCSMFKAHIPKSPHYHIPTFPHSHIFKFSNYSISTSLTNSHAFLPSPGCVTGQVPILVALMRIYRVLVFSKFRANITGPSSLMSSVSAG